MLRTKRKPLVNLREWGRKIRVSKNARLNEKPTEESQPEGSMIFSAPVSEPPSPTYTPVFSPLEEEEDEVKEATKGGEVRLVIVIVVHWHHLL